jgi:MFS transporter, DHA1 family, inner membrane transport protein
MQSIQEDLSRQEEPRPHPRLPGGGWPLLFVLAAIQFTHVLDFIIMMPLGPLYTRELGLEPWQFGLLVSVYGFAAGISSLLLAAFIDRFDRKHAVLFLYGGFTVGTLCCAIAPDYLTLLLARCVAGGFGGVIGAITLAIIGDAFPENRRGLATGVVMSAFSVANIVGVPAGLELASDIGTWVPFAALAGFSALLWASAFFVLPSLRHHQAHGPAPSVGEILRNPTHLRAFALMVCLVLSTSTLFPYFPNYLVFNLGLDPKDDMRTVYIFGGLATLISMPLIGRLADLFGKRPVYRVMALGTMTAIVVFTNMDRAPLPLVVGLTTAFWVVASGRMVPAMALITSSARPAYRGSFMSLNNSVQLLVMGAAAVAGGFLLSQPDPNGPIYGLPLVGALSGVMTLASVFLVGYVRPADAAPAAPTEEEAAEAAVVLVENVP